MSDLARKSNAGAPVEGAKLQVINRFAEMAIYDALPVAWRALIGDLPVQQALGPVAEAYVKLGPRAGYVHVPAWRPTVAEEYPK